MAWLQQLCNSDSQIQISEEGKTQYVSGAGVSAISKLTYIKSLSIYNAN
jgi:hypothetical protein